MDIPKGKDVNISFCATLFGQSKVAAAISATKKAAATLMLDGKAVMAPFKADVTPSGTSSLAGIWTLSGLEGSHDIAILLTNDGTSEEMTCPCSTLVVN